MARRIRLTDRLSGGGAGGQRQNRRWQQPAQSGHVPGRAAGTGGADHADLGPGSVILFQSLYIEATVPAAVGDHSADSILVDDPLRLTAPFALGADH